MAHGAAHWLPLTQPIATALVGLGAFWFARRQWQTASAKLRADLLNKRIEMLEEVRHHHVKVGQDGLQAQDSLRELHYFLRICGSLFDGKAGDLAAETANKAGSLIGVRVHSRNEERLDDNLSEIIAGIGLFQSAALDEMKVRAPKPRWWF